MNGVSDGTRTHDNRDHNPGLYQLSYAHHITKKTHLFGAPGRTRTCYPRLRRPMLYPNELRALNSDHGRGGGIRTPDILLPKQARYQTALHPEFLARKDRSESYLSREARSIPIFSGAKTFIIRIAAGTYELRDK